MLEQPYIRYCDIFGDLHGCFDEWIELLHELGYRTDVTGEWAHPEGRTIVLVGDLTDRGPKNVATLRLVMQLHRAGRLLLVRGNHDDKLRRALLGNRVSVRSGLGGTLAELEVESEVFRAEVIEFLGQLPLQLLLDDDRLLIVHAGIRAELIGRTDQETKAFCLFGETTGRLMTDGFYERLDWTRNYNGAPFVVYGHDPKVVPYLNNRTADIDTGCTFGNRLTALRYPEMELVSVPARRAYSTSKPHLIRPELRTI